MHPRTPLLACALGLVACAKAPEPAPASAPAEAEPAAPGTLLIFAIDVDAFAAAGGADGADRAALLAAAQADALAALRRRVGDRGTVRRRGDQLAVELPEMSAAELAQLRAELRRGPELAIQRVDHASDYMQRLAAHVAADPRAQKRGIGVGEDLWSDPAGGPKRRDPYLRARDRQALEAYLEELWATEPELAVPANRALGYQSIPPAAPGEAPEQRTYYLVSQVELDGGAVADAAVLPDQVGAPVVAITLDPAGAERFAALTAQSVGRKLAIRVGDTIHSAPLVQTPIPGGRLHISLASVGPDPRAAAQDLALALRAASLPAWLILESEARIGAAAAAPPPQPPDGP